MNIRILKFKGSKTRYGRESGCGLSESALLGLGLSLTGATASEVGKSEEQNNMNSAVARESSLQKKFQQTGQGILSNRIQDAGAASSKQQIQQGTGDALGEYNKVNMTPTTGASATSPTASSAVTGGDSQARVGLFNQAAAPIAGMDEWGTKQAIDDLKTRTMLGQNNYLARNQAQTLPSALNAAQNSESGLTSIGSLLSTAGGLTGLWGATNPSSGVSSGGGGAGFMTDGTTLPAFLKKSYSPSLLNFGV